MLKIEVKKQFDFCMLIKPMIILILLGTQNCLYIVDCYNSSCLELKLFTSQSSLQPMWRPYNTRNYEKKFKMFWK